MPASDDDAPGGVPLSDMIETLRGELDRSMQRGAGQAIAFELDKVELELKVAVSRKAKGEGGIAFWVVKAGASLEGQHDAVHTFKLTLKPVAAAGGRLAINADAPGAQAPSNR